jgi:hypothetical protein
MCIFTWFHVTLCFDFMKKFYFKVMCNFWNVENIFQCCHTFILKSSDQESVCSSSAVVDLH